MPPKGSSRNDTTNTIATTTSVTASSNIESTSPSASPSVSHSPSQVPNPTPQQDDKPRLSETAKKANHIASEQKRRQAIREGFDRLTELVPGLEGQGRSESVVLKKTVDFMREKLEERRGLEERITLLEGGRAGR